MGMDVYGKAPTAEPGTYFGLNVWFWRPLAQYISQEFAEIAASCQHWQSNSGAGLGAQAALALANALDEALASGDTQAFAHGYAAAQALAPRSKCTLCDGTGARTDEIGRLNRLDSPGGCNGCTNGFQANPISSYPFTVENVEAFAQFARYSGGFEIS